ncbi:MAG TPA: hypothetical protein VGV35_06530 [Bryobacteraceae bacterium]|nr:hypothetical protein [Bryobacteraceae bacterium]
MKSIRGKRVVAVMSRPRSSRRRYASFVNDYKQRRIDDTDQKQPGAEPASEESPNKGRKRREYLRDYLRWLWPHRYSVGALFALALIVAGLEMVEPLFMRFIGDKVLLNTALDSMTRLLRVNFAGALFLMLVVTSNLVSAPREYRQRFAGKHTSNAVPLPPG